MREKCKSMLHDQFECGRDSQAKQDRHITVICADRKALNPTPTESVSYLETLINSCENPHMNSKQ